MTRTREENAADLQREENDAAERRDLISETFGEPILSTENGDWHLIDSKEKADLAGALSETAIGYFWNHSRDIVEKSPNGESHDWLIMTDGAGQAIVSMAARLESSPSSYERTLLADCHVTGYRNDFAWTEFQDDIEAISALRGLVSYPNYMGKPEADPDESLSM